MTLELDLATKHYGCFGESRDIVMSFETDLQTATKIYFTHKVRIDKLRCTVMKLISDTSNGTVQGANVTGDSAGGLLTVTKNSALNTSFTATPTTNNVVAADSYYQLTSAKADAGGIVLVTIEATRIL